MQCLLQPLFLNSQRLTTYLIGFFPLHYIHDENQYLFFINLIKQTIFSDSIPVNIFKFIFKFLDIFAKERIAS